MGSSSTRRRVARAGFAGLLAFGGAAVLGALAPAASASASPVTFDYNGTDGSDGSAQQYVVPADVCQVTVDVLGAQAGGFSAAAGESPATTAVPVAGEGGHATATVAVTPGETLQVFVGGQGGNGSVSISIGFDLLDEIATLRAGLRRSGGA